jgi:hypothetical protein
LFRSNLAAEVDVSELTWEQKEQVLRELFIRMNMRKSSMTDSTTNAYVFNNVISPSNANFSSRAHLANDGHPMDNNDENSTNVFLTQGTAANPTRTTSEARSTPSSSSVPKLPQITSTNSIL